MFTVRQVEMCRKILYVIVQKGKYDALNIRKAMHKFNLLPEHIMEAKILAYWPSYSFLDRNLYFFSKQDANNFIQECIMPIIIANKLIGE